MKDSSQNKSRKQQHESSIPTVPSSLVRGLGFAVAFSLVGFAIPMTYGSIVELVAYANSPYVYPPAIEWHSVFDTFLSPAIGCSIVFGLAAILNFAPAIRLGAIRSLIFVGISAIAGVYFSAIMAFLFDLQLDWPAILMAISIPCCYTFVHTAQRFTLSADYDCQK